MKQKEDLESNINYYGLNWAGKIKQILDEIGMAELWLSQNTTNITIHHIKQRIIDIYHQTWKTSVDQSNRLSTYSWYKSVLTQEIYLDKIHIRKYKIAFTRFRVSSHDLLIEKGRHFNIK